MTKQWKLIRYEATARGVRAEYIHSFNSFEEGKARMAMFANNKTIIDCNTNPNDCYLIAVTKFGTNFRYELEQSLSNFA